MKLTDKNYHSFEANKYYMSNSQIGAWMKCPKMAYHQYVLGTFKPKESKKGTKENAKFACGSYVHCALLEPHKLDRFKKANPALFCKEGKRKGLLYADYLWCDRAVEVIKSQPAFKSILKGKKERIMTFELDDVPWKAKFDVDGDSFITDIKTTKDFEMSWSVEFNSKVMFYDKWNYWRQMAIYQYAKRYVDQVNRNCFLVAVTKQDPPDCQLFHFKNESRLGVELVNLRFYQQKIVQWKKDSSNILGCGENSCEFCRHSKVITEAVVL